MSVLLGLILCAAWAVGPLTVYALAVWWADRYEREPLWLISVAFLWGAVPAVALSLITSVSVELYAAVAGRELDQLFLFCVWSPLTEEFFKGLAILGLFVFHRRQFDGVLDGVVYGALVGFGFSMSEDFFYYVSALFREGIGGLFPVMFLRGILFALNHSFYTGLVGVGFGLAAGFRQGLGRWMWPVGGFLVAGSFHGIHNFGAYISSIRENDAPVLAQFLGISGSIMLAMGGILMLVGVVAGSWYHQRRIIREELEPEIGTLLTRDELDFLAGKWVQPLFCRKRETVRNIMLVELALKRNRCRNAGSEGDRLTGVARDLFARLKVDFPAERRG